MPGEGRPLSGREIEVLRTLDAEDSALCAAERLGMDLAELAGAVARIRAVLGVASTREALEIARALPAWECSTGP